MFFYRLFSHSPCGPVSNSDCRSSPKLENGHIDLVTRTTSGWQGHITCNPGYASLGGHFTIFCGSDGKWTPSRPRCGKGPSVFNDICEETKTRSLGEWGFWPSSFLEKLSMRGWHSMLPEIVLNNPWRVPSSAPERTFTVPCKWCKWLVSLRWLRTVLGRTD